MKYHNGPWTGIGKGPVVGCCRHRNEIKDLKMGGGEIS